jgi:hypothetical protein
MLSLKRELGALRFLNGLNSRLRDARELHKAVRHTLRDRRGFFQATSGCDEGDQLLLYTDGVSDVLAGAEGSAEARIASSIPCDPAGGAPLLDAILADVQQELARQPQPDDLTLLTARVLGTFVPPSLSDGMAQKAPEALRPPAQKEDRTY